MPWNRNGDTGGTHPAIMSIAGLPGARPGDVNQVAGFYWRLTNQSSAHLTDYVVDAGTVAMCADGNLDYVLKKALKVGLLVKLKIDGRVVYRLLEDHDLVHIRTRAQIEWERQQRADAKDPRLAVPVRFRDGDLCRYCQVVCTWRGVTTNRRGTLDHLRPGEPATVDTLVVACVSCNSSMRDQAGEERAELLPSPAERGIAPFYTETTAKWLTRNGRPVQPTAPPSSEPAASRTTRTSSTAPSSGQRPGSQPDHAPTAASDPPTSGGHRAAPPGRNPAANSNPQSGEQPERMDSPGSGRVGSGNPAFPQPPTQRARRRRRGRRGAGARRQ